MIKGNKLKQICINKLNKKLLVKRSKEMNYGPVQKILFQRKMNKKG